MQKATVLSKHMKEAIYKVRKYFEIEKNAAKTIMLIKKPRGRMAAALGVSFQTVDSVPVITSYRCAYIPYSKDI